MIERGARLRVDDDADVHLDLRMRVEQRQRVIEHRIARVHEVQPQLGMADQYILEEERTANPGAITYAR